MKVCPTCHMTVDGHSECPVCRAVLTDVPYEENAGERYVLNKYLVPYLLRRQKFPLICGLAVLLRLVTSLSQLNIYALAAVLLTADCFANAFFPNRLAKGFWAWKYSEDYGELSCRIGKYASGIGAVILLFLSVLRR